MTEQDEPAVEGPFTAREKWCGYMRDGTPMHPDFLIRAFDRACIATSRASSAYFPIRQIGLSQESINKWATAKALMEEVLEELTERLKLHRKTLKM